MKLWHDINSEPLTDISGAPLGVFVCSRIFIHIRILYDLWIKIMRVHLYAYGDLK